MRDMTCSPGMCLPRPFSTAAVCMASSRVGTRMSAWISVLAGSTRSRQGMQNAAVLPVPFLARASTFRPASAIGITSSATRAQHGKEGGRGGSKCVIETG
jgi:hypothetical protein